MVKDFAIQIPGIWDLILYGNQMSSNGTLSKVKDQGKVLFTSRFGGKDLTFLMKEFIFGCG